MALNFSITDPTLINSTAQVIPTNPRNTTTTISTKTVEPSWAARVSIYPNPSRGWFFISAQDFDIQEVTVSDISGKVIFHTFTFDKNSPLSIEQAGTFFLKIQTSQGVISRKIVRL